VDLRFDPYHDYVVAVGSKGSGKTTLMQRLFASKVPREKVYVLNSSRERSWNNYALPENVETPNMLTLSEFERIVLKFASRKSDRSLMVLDDVDIFPKVKKSEAFYSVVAQSRHLNVGVIVTARLLSSFPLGFYTQADYVFFGSQESQYTAQYVATFIGLENAYSLVRMPEHVFGFWDTRKRTLEKIKLRV
jgi:GTPase SAR1 family protein